MQRYLLLFNFLPTQQQTQKSRVAFAGFSLIFFARSSEMIHQKLNKFLYLLQISIRREENFHFIF